MAPRPWLQARATREQPMASARFRPISRSRRPYNADRLSTIAVACGAGPPCLRKAPHHHSRVTPTVACSALFDNPCPAGEIRVKTSSPSPPPYGRRGAYGADSAVAACDLPPLWWTPTRSA